MNVTPITNPVISHQNKTNTPSFKGSQGEIGNSHNQNSSFPSYPKEYYLHFGVSKPKIAAVLESSGKKLKTTQEAEVKEDPYKKQGSSNPSKKCYPEIIGEGEGELVLKPEEGRYEWIPFCEEAVPSPYVKVDEKGLKWNTEEKRYKWDPDTIKEDEDFIWDPEKNEHILDPIVTVFEDGKQIRMRRSEARNS